MITIGSRQVSLIAYGRKSVAMICKGANIVWQAVSSCFASGSWNNAQGWQNNEAWKN